MKKSLILLVLICLMAAGFSGTAAADEENKQSTSQSGKDPSVEGEWSGDGEDWRYVLPDGEYLERKWLLDSGKWYYFDEDGYMQTGMQRISGKYYYFRPTGEMAVGWVYDEDSDAWYYMNDDGTRKTGWLSTGGAWYWFDSKGVMYHDGFRMVSGHKYYFFDNGQMAANQYVETYFYDADGLRDRRYDITIQGKRRPTDEEKEAISKALANIPRAWIEKFVNAGWEIMFYTDKNYFSAPATEQGIYYVYHKTDLNYKKLKFTKPESLAVAFGEYVAHETKNDKEENGFMVDFQQYLTGSTLISPLPSYFDDKLGMWFGVLMEGYCDENIRYDIKRASPELAAYMAEALGTDFSELKPSVEEWYEEKAEEDMLDSGGLGPAWDEELGNKEGPADALTSQ